MCTKKIHKIITEDGPICNFDIGSIAEMSRITGINRKILNKRMERLENHQEISVDKYLSPPKSIKIFKPRKRPLTIAQQCRQAGVKQGTYWRRIKKGASHKQALNIDFMLDRRYKLRYLPINTKPNLYCEKKKFFCYGHKFEGFEEIAYVFDVNQKRIERLSKMGLSIEDAIAHRDSKNTGLITFGRLEKSEKLRKLHATLYFAIIYMQGKKLLKIGYTTKNVDDRLKLISKSYKVIFYASDILYEVFKSEQFIIEKVLDRGYSSCELDVDGRSEIFEYSGYLENVVWDALDFIFGRKIVNNHFDFIL